MTAESVTFELPETIKVEECHTLDEFIRSAADRAIVLDGHRVRKFSGLAAQLIAAHQGTRHEANVRIVHHPSITSTDRRTGNAGPQPSFAW